MLETRDVPLHDNGERYTRTQAINKNFVHHKQQCDMTRNGFNQMMVVSRPSDKLTHN